MATSTVKCAAALLCLQMEQLFDLYDVSSIKQFSVSIRHMDLARDDFQITLLRILESVADESLVILKSPDIFTREVLPSLAVLYKGNKDGDTRFLCFKILFDVMVIFLNEQSEDEPGSKELQSISNTNFLPLYPSLIEDEDPIPLYAQKLLVMLIDYSYIKSADILHLKIVCNALSFCWAISQVQM
ncbi:hypothetical protein RchiOBHm_Chr4g0420821 [Rosa chinensis]|uniref:Serine/threonine-protein kinase ULK4/RUNKEL HEAT repeats domain-containing protein n=1 Tax=Rosa chinensis TaxID=74649 RepID=A0A2P6QXY1_ROSCH|nr:hypothetical protein RchiOBHm_Chr4g0420821 [Rosa chinensis]